MNENRGQAAFPPYRVFDHTADLGVEIYGINKEELFCNSAFCRF